MYNSINSYLKISLLLVNIYNNTDCQQRQNIVVALYYKCSVALPHGAVGWSAVCDGVFPDHTYLLFVLLGHCCD